MKIRSDEPVSNLKQALQYALGKAPMKAEAVAEELGLATSTLYNYCNEHIPDQQMPLRYVVPFCRITGCNAPVEFMAQQLGLLVVAVPQVHCGKDAHAAFLKTLKEVGEFAAALEKALADGLVSDAEKCRLIKEAWDIVKAAAGAYHAARRIVSNG